ncbi:hypothetical protein J3R82DRAFT_9933 [Butyriboletus roseoflavus]|nr:hypothetical protein J3R82DRAFT_9933 [Butyriboletus roseoflavus]
MKRASVGLVEYPSSEEETPAKEQPEHKKRKLPTLSSSLTVPTPVDNPALHQGRVRTVPHVEGQYATYIYVPLVLDHKDALYTLVEDAVTLAKTHVPFLHTIGRQERDGVRAARWELHISLSHPLFLRAHQRDEFKRVIRQMASSIAPFDASFATFSELANDERTRTFLTLDVGAGHGEVIEFSASAEKWPAVPDDLLQLRRCLDLLGPTLQLLRQKEFYVDPKFHTSIAWALLEKTASSFNITPHSTAGKLDGITLSESVAPEEQNTRSASPTVVEQSSYNLHRIPHFPHTLVPSLNKAYAARLSQARTGGFVVDKISAKIGSDVFTWPLNGMN